MARPQADARLRQHRVRDARGREPGARGSAGGHPRGRRRRDRQRAARVQVRAPHVAAPGERGLRPEPARAREAHGGGVPAHVDRGVEDLRPPELGRAGLRGEPWPRVHGHARGVRVEAGPFEVPARRVRLVAVEGGGLELRRPPDEARRGHPERDVRGVQPMVRDRSLGDVHAGESVHESRGTQGGFSGQAEVAEDAEQRGAVGERRGGAVHEGRGPHRGLARAPEIGERARPRSQRVRVDGGQLHREVVRVLVVHEVRAAVGRLARLQEEPISFWPHQGLQAAHRPQREHPAAQPAAGRGHGHVRAESLPAAAGPALVREDPEQAGVDHHAPGAREGVQPRHLRRLRLPARARGVAVHRVVAEDPGVVRPLRGARPGGEGCHEVRPPETT